MESSLILILSVGAVVLGIVAFVAGYFVRKLYAERLIRTAESKAREILVMAKRESEEVLKKADKESKTYLAKVQLDFENKIGETRKNLESLEKTLRGKEDLIEQKLDIAQKKEKEALFKLQESTKKEEALSQKERDLEALYEEERTALQKIAKLDPILAKAELLKRMEIDLRDETSRLITENEAQLHAVADKKAKEILGLAMQRIAAAYSMESTVTVVALPAEEMKGRIIGKDGRNIKTFETLTGVDLIIDDTPSAVTLSAFDGYRREIARIALEELVKDGRIQPARIEEVVQKTKKNMENVLKDDGERAIAECNLGNFHPELVKLIGRLKYRSSYGQNTLMHSIEVAHLMSVIAGEMGLDSTFARRAGLLHDIGKAAGQENEGPHALIGGELARRYGEHPDIVHAVEAHHEDLPIKNVWPVLVQAADSLSAARPGARRESLENYISRLTKLEDLADRHPGVEKSYVIQGGREIRVVVKPERVPEAQLPALAHEISKEIKESLEHPGQVKVIVIRETRVEDVAK